MKFKQARKQASKTGAAAFASVESCLEESWAGILIYFVF